MKNILFLLLPIFSFGQVDSIHIGMSWPKVVQFVTNDTDLTVNALSGIHMNASYDIDPYTYYELTFDIEGKLNYMAFFKEDITDIEIHFFSASNSLVAHGRWIDLGDKGIHPGPLLPGCIKYEHQRSFKHYEIEGMQGFVGIAECVDNKFTLEIKFFYSNP